MGTEGHLYQAKKSPPKRAKLNSKKIYLHN